MKVTYTGGQSLRALLADRGVPAKDLTKAVDQIVELNGLGSARGIPEGTVLTFPSTLDLGDSKVRLKKVVGDVANRGDGDLPKPSGGRPMGSMGIFAFDDLRRGGGVSACGPEPHPIYSGCSVSACGGSSTSTRRRRSSSSGSGVSACGPAPHPAYSGCSVSACGGSSTSTRRRRSSSSSGSGVSTCGPAPHPAYSGCSVSACGGSSTSTRRRRSSSGSGTSACGGTSRRRSVSGCG